MGFDNAKGLGLLMNNCEVSAAKLSELEECLRKEGLIVDDDTLDMEEVGHIRKIILHYDVIPSYFCFLSFKELSVDEEISYIKPSFPEHPCDYQHLVNWRKVGSRSFFNQRDKFVDPVALQKLTGLRVNHILL